MDEKAKSVDVGSMHGDQIMPRGAHGQGWAEPDPGSARIGPGLGLMFECSGCAWIKFWAHLLYGLGLD